MPVLITRRNALQATARVAARVARLVALAALTACLSGNLTDPPVGTALTALPRDLTPAERSVQTAANAFSFALWDQLLTTSRDSNVFVSPLSASFALGMALDGAATQTFDEMRSSLQFGATPLESIDTGYKSLFALLTSLDPSTTTQIANSIWYRNTFPFNQSFLNDGAAYFGATISPLDFANAAASTATINAWVDTETHGKIPSIIDGIDPSDVMFLINAIYFKGTWRERFDSTATSIETFHAATGDQNAPLMHRTADMSYAETPTFQAVDLPYGDSAFTMTVLLPKAPANVESVAASLTPASWAELTTSLAVRRLDLSLPKLTLSWKHGLIPALRALGMNAAFDSNRADFSRMTPAPVFISDVTQRAAVSIDEQGTEAAAVTVVGVQATSLPLSTVMRVDHPFVFVIRERLSGTILFMGKVVAIPTQ